MKRLRKGPGAIAIEVVLFAALSVIWLAAYLAATDSLASLPLGSRNFLLAIYETDSRLYLAPILGVLGSAALMLRHRWAQASLVIVGGLVIAIEWLFPYVTQVQFATWIMLVVASFWALWKTERFAVTAAFALVVGTAVTLPSFQVNRNLDAANNTGGFPDVTSVVASLQSIILVTMAILAAALVRRFDSQAAELAQRNQELEEQRAATARAAVLDERVRISRELHDVVAHHVTTMTVHAGAARQVAATNPEAANDSLHQIETAGRDAVTELQRLLGFLRGDDTADEQRTPVPSLRHLERLGSSIGGGFECDIFVEGDLTAIPQSVDVSAYRIVQEALTNVMKHSTADRAEVSVTAGSNEVELHVVDHGSGRTRNGGANGTGHGLLGMRERAALHGGSIEVGPNAGGRGWLVAATLPYRGSPS